MCVNIIIVIKQNISTDYINIKNIQKYKSNKQTKKVNKL